MHVAAEAEEREGLPGFVHVMAVLHPLGEGRHVDREGAAQVDQGLGDVRGRAHVGIDVRPDLDLDRHGEVVPVVRVETEVGARPQQAGDAGRIGVHEVRCLGGAGHVAAQVRAVEAAEVVHLPHARLRRARTQVGEDREVVRPGVEGDLELRDVEVSRVGCGDPEAAFLLLTGLERRTVEDDLVAAGWGWRRGGRRVLERWQAGGTRSRAGRVRSRSDPGVDQRDLRVRQRGADARHARPFAVDEGPVELLAQEAHVGVARHHPDLAGRVGHRVVGRDAHQARVGGAHLEIEIALREGPVAGGERAARREDPVLDRLEGPLPLTRHPGGERLTVGVAGRRARRLAALAPLCIDGPVAAAGEGGGEALPHPGRLRFETAPEKVAVGADRRREADLPETAAGRPLGSHLPAVPERAHPCRSEPTAAADADTRGAHHHDVDVRGLGASDEGCLAVAHEVAAGAGGPGRLLGRRREGGERETRGDGEYQGEAGPVVHEASR